MPGLGTGIGLGFGKSAGFSPEYQAVYDLLTTKPSDAIAAEQNKMVSALVGGGVWAKMGIFYLFAQTTNAAGEAQINWKTPGSYNAVLTVAPTFTALEGFTGNLVDQYITIPGEPLQTLAEWTLNDASFSFYQRKSEYTNYVVGGTNIMAQGISSQRVRIRINEAINDIIDAGSNAGTTTGSRTGATIKKGYFNKTLYLDSTSVATSRGSQVTILSRDAGDYCDGQVSIFCLGAGVTKAEHDTMHDAFETYMDSNGKGVVP